MTDPHHTTVQRTVLIVVIILSALTLGVTLTYGYLGQQNNRSEHKIIVRVDGNGALSIAQAKRTECRAVRSAALDKARWGKVADLLTEQNASPEQVVAAGIALKTLPSIDVLTNKGGTIEGTRYPPCPPSIAKETP